MWNLWDMAPQEPEPRLSLSLCWYRLDLGGGRSGLVQAHADPGEGHPFGPGGERPAGSSPDRIWKDGRLRCTCNPAHPGLQTGEETYFGSLCVAMQSKTSLPCCIFWNDFILYTHLNIIFYIVFHCFCTCFLHWITANQPHDIQLYSYKQFEKHRVVITC